jgi:predicted aspartyl protease
MGFRGFWNYRNLFLFVFANLLAVIFFNFHPAVAQSQNRVSLPFITAPGGTILVKIKVMGEPITCIVDTGTPYFMVLDETLAQNLHLQQIPMSSRLKFFIERQGEKTTRVIIPKIQIASFKYHDMSAVTAGDIRMLTGGASALTFPDFRAQGILGMGFFQAFHMILNYPEQKIVFYPSDVSSSFVDFSRPTVEVAANGNQFPFLLDTGSSHSVVSEKVVNALGMKRVVSQIPNPPFNGVAKANRLKIGSIHVRHVTMALSKNFSRYSGTYRLKGIIGYDLMRNLILDLNFSEGTIRLKKE